jgi:hypothetical protein
MEANPVMAEPNRRKSKIRLSRTGVVSAAAFSSAKVGFITHPFAIIGKILSSTMEANTFFTGEGGQVSFLRKQIDHGTCNAV